MKTFKIFTAIGLLLFCTLPLFAVTNHSIDVTNIKTDVMRGHLDLGGRNLAGDTIGVNNFYLEKNGIPFIPVVGEFHFSRYPKRYWDEEIKKMKAGGITVVATYVFWNMHEFKEGVFEWTGDFDVRHFTELCAQNGMDVIMRVGPFDHGEIRNGGLPDWLYGRPIDVRSTDPKFLYYVDRLYNEIGKQLKGLFFKDGGPIIAVQIENEYQHSASPWGFTYQDAPRENTVAMRDRKITQVGVGVNDKGNDNVGTGYMKTLKQMAVNAGLIAPLYTATGWGFASIVEKGSLPVMAGYAFPYWTSGNEPSPYYLFKDIKSNPDYSPVSYDVNLYPSLAAELGTGMSVTWARRPRVPGESMLPMMVRTVGSGTNGLGFYMYHGGTTPSIGNYSFTEGFGLNYKSYDYQAPIGEFGQTTSGFYSLKLINYFLRDFGADLAPLRTVLPSGNDEIKPENLSALRYAVRSDGKKGYLFMNNYQDHLVTSDLNALKIDVQTQSGKISFPTEGTFNLKSGVSAIFPFNVSYNGIEVRMATVQPFCQFENKGKTYMVMASVDGITPELLLKGIVQVKGAGIKVDRMDGYTHIVFPNDKICEVQINDCPMLILPNQQALNAYLVGKTDKKLVISQAIVMEEEGTISLVGTRLDSTTICIYPSVDELSSTNGRFIKKHSTIKNMGQWNISMPKMKPMIQISKADERHFVLKAEGMDWSTVNDVYVTFDYRGDRGICMMNGELQTDNFYTSAPWTIGLKRYAEALKKSEMYFYFVPMEKNAAYLSYLDKDVLPDFGAHDEFLEIRQPELKVEYKLPIVLH